MKTKNTLAKDALKIAILATLTVASVGTASALSLSKELKRIGNAVEKAGQDTIDVVREPVRKVLPGEVTKHTDATADFVIGKRIEAEIAIAKAIDDPVGYMMQLPGSLISDVCSAPVQYYGKVMEEQARGRWQPLPDELIQSVQDNYGVDLRSVQYVEGVTTSNGQAQTIGKRIYFPTWVDLTTESGMHWMLHELEHTVQFSNATYGTAGKLCEYVAKAIGSGGRHDAIDMERAADAKANYLLGEALAAINYDAYANSPASTVSEHQLHVTNTTDVPITFEMATRSLGIEPETLLPGESSVFSGEIGDAEFYIRIGTSTWQGNFSREYTIPAGSKTLIAANPHNGVYEVYYEGR